MILFGFRVEFYPMKWIGLLLACWYLWIPVTFWCGRFFCRRCCPLGLSQSLVHWLTHPRSHVRRVCTELPRTRLQRCVNVLVLLVYFALPVGAWLHPWGIFGRAVLVLTLGAGASLAVVLALAVFGKGRIWCNWVCPLGTVFDAVARLGWHRDRPCASCKNCRACFPKAALALALVLPAGMALAGPPALADGASLECVRDESFSGERLDTSFWADYVPSFLGRSSGFLFSRDNVAVSNGCLNLTARNLRAEERTVENLSRGYDKYATAIVRSREKFRYGYFEARAKGMRASVCNAFWLFDPLSDRPREKHRPGSFSDEIDIFEIFGDPVRRAERRTLFSTVHRMVTPYVEATAGCGQTKLPRKTCRTKVDFDFWAGFHTYGFLWTPTELSWYLDGVRVFARTNDQFHAAMHVTLDCEIMPDWAGNPPPETLPQVFSIDYVRIYALKGVALPPVPKCVPAADRVTGATFDRFCLNNFAALKGPARALVIDHPDLGWTAAARTDGVWRRDWAVRGIACIRPLTGPWSWMNAGAVALTDRLVALARERLCPGKEKLPVISLGTGAGGLSALVWPCYSRQSVACCLVREPIRDLPAHVAAHPELLPTVAAAFAAEADLDFALRQHSPSFLVDAFLKAPVREYVSDAEAMKIIEISP